MTKDSENKPGSLAFMPWATVVEKCVVGNWELIPVTLKRLTDKEKEIRRILRCYKIHSNLQIASATVLKKIDQHPLYNLTEEEREECFLIGEIISFCSVAEREFFSFGYYTNSSAQALVIQSFVENSGGFSIVSRRRDGNSTNYSPDEYFQVLQPSQVSGRELKFNPELATAILKAQNLPDWNNLYEGIFCFLRANTDDNAIHVQAELMFSMGAFERLLGVNNGKCVEAAKRFSTLLAKVLKEMPKSTDDKRDYKNLAAHTSVREIWMRDFCTCRGDMAHGRKKQGYQSIWSHGEHLLLAADIFPVLVKIHLSQNSLYTLTDNDLRQIYYFDNRLRAANLFRVAVVKHEPKFGWEEVRRKAVWLWAADKKDLLVSTTASAKSQPPGATSKEQK